MKAKARERRQIIRTLEQIHGLLTLITVIVLTRPGKPKVKRGRRGSGLHGRRTEVMLEEITDFRQWLTAHPVNGEHNDGTLNARAKQFWIHFHTNKKGGFASYKNLARAARG